jgi:hypothetical protein
MPANEQPKLMRLQAYLKLASSQAPTGCANSPDTIQRYLRKIEEELGLKLIQSYGNKTWQSALVEWCDVVMDAHWDMTPCEHPDTQLCDKLGLCVPRLHRALVPLRNKAFIASLKPAAETRPAQAAATMATRTDLGMKWR